MFFYKCVLYNCSFAKYAAAFFKISLSCCANANSLLSLRFSASNVSTLCFLILPALVILDPCYLTHLYKVLLAMPRFLAA